MTARMGGQPRPGPRPSQSARLPAAGPIGRVLATDRTQLHGEDLPLRAGANALILLRRVAFVDSTGVFDAAAGRCLLGWAQDHDLGQDPDLVRRIAARRGRAVARACASRSHPGRVHRRIKVRPLWRLAVGLGNRTNPYEIGLSMHGTYGWPTVPGSTLKGVTCAYAASTPAVQADPSQFNAIFGLPRIGSSPDVLGDESGADAGDGPADVSGGSACEGTVTFLDALPLGGPVEVLRDVVTPHVQPYYRDSARPPAEYHNPVPAEYLVIGGGTFAIDLLGSAEHVEQAAAWCAEAVDDLGVGAKTASGYGYLSTEPQ